MFHSFADFLSYLSESTDNKDNNKFRNRELS